MKPLHILLITLLALAACSTPSPKKSPFAFGGMDSTVRPGDNFFRFANGHWYDTARIPSTQPGVGYYMFMNYPQRLRLEALLDSVSKANNPTGSIEQKVGDFYASGMDTTTINQRGYQPVKPVLDQIDAITDVASLMKFVADQTKAENGSIMGFGVSPDNNNSSLNVAHTGQAGLGLPDRDYYFNKDSSTVAIQNAYKTYLATLFTLTGTDAGQSAKDADMAYAVEKQLAVSHKTREEMRDVRGNYHMMKVKDLAKKEPNIGWRELLDNLGAKTDSIDISQPGYYETLNALLKRIPISDWKIYLKAHTLTNYADILSRPFQDASFAYNKVVTGQAVQKTRGEIITNAVDNELGMALAQLYVKKYFPESAKKRMLELVNNLQKAWAVRVDHLDWMSDSTKTKAKEKLFAITKKIGYPHKWRDYSKVEVAKDKYFENTVSANSNDYQYNLAKVNQLVDKTEWFTTPPTVTAYNNPYGNEIVFPAGILQFPYFDNNADDAINYGGIGMVIGHEMTHTFDDQGAQFDKDGNVKNWWTKEDYARFKEKTQQIIDLYNTFTVLDTVHVIGARTVGENAADISGVAVAYDAFKMTPEGQDSTKIDGLTPDQRFFLSVARIWRVKMTDQFLRLWIKTNPHSPPMWRVNGPLMNNPHFYDAFNVKPGDKMYLAPDERVGAW